MLHGVEQPHSLTRSSRPSFCAACRMVSASGGVKLSTTAPFGPASLTSLIATELASETGTFSVRWTIGMFAGLGQRVRPGRDVPGARDVGLVEDDLGDVLGERVLHRPVRAVPRAHVDRGAVRGRVALGRDARVDDVEAELLPVAAVHRALDDGGVADDADHLVGLHQLLGVGRDLGRVGLLGLDVELDRVAVDAAVGVDAVEVGLGHVRDVGERGARLVGGDGAERDRGAGRRDPGLGAALRRADGRGARRAGRGAGRGRGRPGGGAAAAAATAAGRAEGEGGGEHDRSSRAVRTWRGNVHSHLSPSGR